MLKRQLRWAGRGEDSTLLVLHTPLEYISADAPTKCLAIPVLNREGGLLLVLPQDYLLPHALIDAAVGDELSLIGPSISIAGPMLEEDENGMERQISVEGRFLFVDFRDEVLESLTEYDPVIDPSEVIQVYSDDHPTAIPDVPSLMSQVNAWLETLGDGPRSNFQSAREEQETEIPLLPKTPARKAAAKRVSTATLAQQVEALTVQLRVIAEQQQAMTAAQSTPPVTPAAEPMPGAASGVRLPGVSSGLVPGPSVGVPKVAQLLGPRTRAPALRPSVVPDTGETLENMAPVVEASAMEKALVQQSAVLTSLVAHLTSNDPMTELASSSTGTSLNTKGAARREKMQQELASGQSNYFMDAQRQIFKKMHPSKALPKDDDDLKKAGVSMCTYLEKFGGYRNRTEAGMIMWMLSHAMDAAADSDFHRTREYLALTTACLEQATLDGQWSIAYVLSLLEEPPNQVFSERMSAMTSLGRPFSPLIPASWSATALAYVKEMDILSTKKLDSKSPKASPARGGDGNPTQPSPQPKRPKYPKKPKGGAEPPPKAAWIVRLVRMPRLTFVRRSLPKIHVTAP